MLPPAHTSAPWPANCRVAVAPAGPPSGPPMRSTTMWVGRIAPTIEPHFIRQLLEACGKLREWKPVMEQDTGKLKGFGFVTYADPEGVLVAQQVLNNLKVDGQELALKCNKVRRGLGAGAGARHGCMRPASGAAWHGSTWAKGQ